MRSLQQTGSWKYLSRRPGQAEYADSIPVIGSPDERRQRCSDSSITASLSRFVTTRFTLSRAVEIAARTVRAPRRMRVGRPKWARGRNRRSVTQLSQASIRSAFAVVAFRLSWRGRVYRFGAVPEWCAGDTDLADSSLRVLMRSLLMRRRTFLQAGAGAAALTLAAGNRSSPQSPGQPVIAAETDTADDLATVVVGADGSQPVSEIVDKYLQAQANVWHYLPNLPEFDKVDALINSDSRVILARSYADILAAKAAGKVSMVCGWQNSAPLEEAAGNDWRGSTPPRTKLQYYYDRGLRTANLCYNLSNSFGGGCLDPTVPLTRQGKFIIGQMQDIGILVDTGGHTGEPDQPRRHRDVTPARRLFARECVGAQR